MQGPERALDQLDVIIDPFAVTPPRGKGRPLVSVIANRASIRRVEVTTSA